MALENDFPQNPATKRRHLELLPGGRATVFTSAARARTVLRRITLVAAIACSASAAWLLGDELLELLGRGVAILFTLALAGFTAWLVIDTLRNLR